jgi:DNA-binding beta-propeller fold protein YncE
VIRATSRHAAVLVAAALVAAAVTAAGALAAVGDLTFRGCIKDEAAGECASSAHGLDAASSVATSPNGKSVYVASQLDGAVAKFDRNPSTGALSNPSCVSDDTAGDAACGASVKGLAGAISVAVSRDGRSVYAVSIDDSAIVTFKRNTTNGALSSPTCIEDDVVGTSGCGSTAPGLNGPTSVAVSPDDKSVYVTSVFDNTIVTFDRDTTSPGTGDLSSPTCIKDAAAGECGSTAPGLSGAESVAVSPDNGSVYVASFFDDAIVRFDRDTTTGGLSSPSCVKDAAAGECGASAEGLDGARWVAVSPDRKSVYVTGETDDTVVSFNRDTTTGALSSPSCVKDVAAGECGAAAEGLDGVRWVDVSPDNRSVYVASDEDSTIVRFNRSTTTGALSSPSCIKDEAPAECTASARGLERARSVVVSPDNRSVYAASQDDDAIVRFDREVPASPQPPPPHGQPADKVPPDTAITRGPKKKVKTKKKKKKVSFEFSSEAGASFECALDDGAFEPCTSPLKAKVRKGKHSFQVRAKDTAGNTDPSPAETSFKVKRKKRK